MTKFEVRENRERVRRKDVNGKIPASFTRQHNLSQSWGFDQTALKSMKYVFEDMTWDG